MTELNNYSQLNVGDHFQYINDLSGAMYFVEMKKDKMIYIQDYEYMNKGMLPCPIFLTNSSIPIWKLSIEEIMQKKLEM